jgi:hypothetical protein
VAAGLRGADGTFGSGVTDDEGVEATEEPEALVAVTVKVYPVPLVSPVTVHVVAPLEEHVKDPGDDVTVYPVTIAPPLFEGAVQLICEEELTPPTPDTPVGAPGTVEGVIGVEAADQEPVPTALVAATSNS